MFKKDIKKILLTVLSLILIALFINFISDSIKPEAIIQFIEPLGSFAPFMMFLLLALTNILPPFPVVPFWLVTLAIFPKPEAMALIYIANVTGNTSNFLIARYLGKPTVIKLAGKAGLEKIEKLTGEITGFPEFLIIRILGGGLTDYISYAAGFTKITPLKYIVATILGLIPVTFIGIFMLNKALSFKSIDTIGTLVIFYLLNYFMAVATPTIIIAIKRKRKS